MELSGVRTNKFVTDEGILQGIVLGPVLFSLLIGKLEKLIKNKMNHKNTQSSGAKTGSLKISLIMFADDLAQVTNNYYEVQIMLNIAVDFFKKAPRLSFGAKNVKSWLKTLIRKW